MASEWMARTNPLEIANPSTYTEPFFHPPMQFFQGIRSPSLAILSPSQAILSPSRLLFQTIPSPSHAILSFCSRQQFHIPGLFFQAVLSPYHVIVSTSWVILSGRSFTLQRHSFTFPVRNESKPSQVGAEQSRVEPGQLAAEQSRGEAEPVIE